jgi:hypothetical protein
LRSTCALPSGSAVARHQPSGDQSPSPCRPGGDSGAPDATSCTNSSTRGCARAGQRDLPTGTAPLLVDAAIHVALGRRRRLDRRTPPSEQWRVKPTRLASLDLDTLQSQRWARPPRRFRHFLGIDSRGRLIAQTASIRLLDPIAYRTLATWTSTDPMPELWSACHVAPTTWSSSALTSSGSLN